MAGLPVQVIGDGAPTMAHAPSQCSSTGRTWARAWTPTVCSASERRYECGLTCTPSTAPAIYFACADQGCAPATLPLRQQVINPVALLATHNIGVALVLQDVAAHGASTPEGALVLGIGTTANNQVGAAQVLSMDRHYQLTTIYKG